MVDRTLKMSLPVPLNDAERTTKALELAAMLQEYDDVELAKKAATSQHTMRMKELRAQATEVRRVVTTGKENRLVDCWQEPNAVKRVWEVFRVDTGEKVVTRTMTAEELAEVQQPTFFDQRAPEGFKKAPADAASDD